MGLPLQQRTHRPDGWTVGVVVCAVILSLPVLTVIAQLLQPFGDNWGHLIDTVLADYVSNSLLLVLGVAVGTLFLGVGSASLVSLFDFPGRRWLEWLLLLPLAFPAYIIAYTYTGMLDIAGPVQETLRGLTGWRYGDYWFPEIRSLGGAMVMMSLVLYPYVYLLTRAAFLQRSAAAEDAARILGSGPWAVFRKVTLPSARPAMVAGLSLALMETLADYGTVAYFGIATFTTGIFRTWFGMDDATAASQLAGMLLGFVFLLVWLERSSRRKARYHDNYRQRNIPQPLRLFGWKAWLALALGAIPVLLGFLIPGGQLLAWTIEAWDDTVDAEFLTLVWNSVALAGGAALLALLLALFLAYGKRLRPGPLLAGAVRMASMGYAVPGAVIAVGVMLPLAALDNSIDALSREWFGVSTGLIFSGTIFTLLLAYMVRFLSVSLQTVESGLGTIRPSMDDSARTLGCSPGEVLWHIHIPMLRPSLIAAVLLVFVDVMKELPATLILRPFNFNTLAVRAFELASDELLIESASAAIMIVLVGIIPVIMLSRSMTKH